MLVLRPSDITTIASHIAAGNVGVVPSDTIYGLACSARNHGAVTKLYEIKHREQKPGTIIAASVDQLVQLGLKPRYVHAVQHLWPNPISVVIPVSDDLAYLHLGKRSLAVRIPRDKTLLTLLEQTGPLQTTSANFSGEPPANTILEAQSYFGDAVDFYVDGGDLSGRLPSTVLQIIDDAIVVLRQGAVEVNEAGRIAGQ